MIRGDRWVGDDAPSVATEAARRFLEIGRAAIHARGRFVVALAGGSTPKATYQLLAREAADPIWRSTEFTFGDERCVPPEHPDSNYGMAKRALFDPAAIDPARVHRMRGEADDGDAQYQAELEGLFPDEAWPRFDLVLLGMGPDGHTASLFPHTGALDEDVRWVVKNRVEKLDTNRLTLTPPALNAARAVIITTCGDEKAEVLGRIDRDNEDTDEHPILLVRPTEGSLTWLIDLAAAKKLGT